MRINYLLHNFKIFSDNISILKFTLLLVTEILNRRYTLLRGIFIRCSSEGRMCNKNVKNPLYSV